MIENIQYESSYAHSIQLLQNKVIKILIKRNIKHDIPKEEKKME